MKRKAGTVELLEEGRAPSAIDRYVMPAKRTRLDGMRSTDFARPTGCTQCGGAMGYDRRVKADCCMGRLYCTWITETTYRITRADPCGYTSMDQPLNDQTPDNTAALSANSTNKQRARAYTSYNASNHMAEWIKRVDGREQTPIPKDLLSMIREELRRRHIREQDVIPEVTLAMMRFIREYRNYDCRCFFENVYKITNLIARRQQPLISYEFSEQIMQMFYLFKHAFREMPAELKNGRTSIPEYGYLIYMFSLLQGYTPILEMLPLIQGDNVLADYNRMMLWTCRHLNWPVTRLSPTSIHRTGNS